MQIFTKSLVFASIKHQNQRRKNAGDIPYINHPIEVAHILARAGVSDHQILAAGILHDTVQDTHTTPQELENEFGARVAGIVMECTDDKKLGKIQRKKYQIEKALIASNEAKLVKIADKISNNSGLLIEAPKSWTAQRVRGYHLWSEAVCKNLKGVNEHLDKQMESVLQKAGISGISNQEKKALLQAYYESMLGGEN